MRHEYKLSSIFAEKPLHLEVVLKSCQTCIINVVILVEDSEKFISINGVVVTWVVAIDPPGVRFPLNAWSLLIVIYTIHVHICSYIIYPLFYTCSGRVF